MLAILHQDERCVAVDKPSGVATHRGWADDNDALLQRVRDAVDAYVYPIAPGLANGHSVLSGYDLDRPDPQQRRGRKLRAVGPCGWAAKEMLLGFPAA